MKCAELSLKHQVACDTIERMKKNDACMEAEFNVRRKKERVLTEQLKAAETQLESLARTVMLDQVSNDCVLSNDDFHEGDYIDVYKLTLPGGDSCYYGVESTAKAAARTRGTVELVRIPRREFTLVDIEEKNKYQARVAILSDKLNGTPCAEIRWAQEKEELECKLHEEKELLQTTVNTAIVEQDDLRMTIKRLYRKLPDKESDFAKAVHAQIQGWGHNAMREEE